MRLRRVAPLVALAGTITALAIPLAIGSGRARVASAIALGGLLAGLYGAVRQHRVEYGDDERPPTLPVLVADTVEQLGGFWVALGAYMTIIFLAVAAPGSGPREESRWAGPVIATASGAALVVAMVWAVRSARQKEGVERAVFYESAAIAFVITVVAAAVYGLFEAFARAPTISMWAVWGVGMLAFGVASGVVRRRTS